jgi:hypothetical protein
MDPKKEVTPKGSDEELDTSNTTTHVNLTHLFALVVLMNTFLRLMYHLFIGFRSLFHRH